MPYALPSGSDPNTTGVQLRVDTPRWFTVTTPFWYAPFRPLPPKLDALLPIPADPPDADHRWLEIPGDHRTDLGSVPGVLWGLVASYGRHTLAVIVHDFIASLALGAPAAEGFDRASAADEVFYAALRDPDAGRFRASPFRSLVLWTGVSVGRYYTHHRAGFAALAAATIGAWTAGWWLAENLGGRPLPVAGWVLLTMGLIVLAVAGVVAARLERLRASDVWVVRALAAGAAALLLAAAWTTMPIPPLFGVGVPAFLAILGVLAFLAGSGFLLAVSPVRRDVVLPLVLTVAAPTVGVVALVTIGVLYLLWLPDAFVKDTTGPVNTVNARRRSGG